MMCNAVLTVDAEMYGDWRGFSAGLLTDLVCSEPDERGSERACTRRSIVLALSLVRLAGKVSMRNYIETVKFGQRTWILVSRTHLILVLMSTAVRRCIAMLENIKQG